MKTIIKISFILAALSAGLPGCKKLVEVQAPVTSLNGGNVYNADATAIAVQTGIYANLSNGTGTTPASWLCGLGADELTLFPGSSRVDYIQYYTNALNNQNQSDFWQSIYPQIYTANSVIAGVSASSSLTPAVKQQLLGEAYFMRAFFYFYLVNFYGDVPLALTTDYQVNALLPRAPASQVYQLIISDLKQAQGLLSAGFTGPTLLQSTTERVRPTRWAATALLARVYLYTGDWVDAEAQATAVINQSNLFSLVPLAGDVFQKNSNEAIWQLQPTVVGYNTLEGRLFILPPSGPDPINFPVYLNPGLVAAFEPGDQRKTTWTASVSAGGTTYYYAYKYQVFESPSLSEYEMVLRLGEQYLIRSEARAEQNNIPGAQADLNMIRSRAGLPNTTAGDKTSLLAAILHERQVELFTEYGHRWLDLKRTGTIDAVMQVADTQKGSVWHSYQQLYPVLTAELKADPNLKQNPGY